MAFFEKLGLDLAIVIAGLVGGVISLAFIRELSLKAAALSIIAGTGTAAYLTPLARNYFELSDKFENGVAFLLGLVAMNVLAGIFKLSERFKNNPNLGAKK